MKFFFPLSFGGRELPTSESDGTHFLTRSKSFRNTFQAQQIGKGCGSCFFLPLCGLGFSNSNSSIFLKQPVNKPYFKHTGTK